MNLQYKTDFFRRLDKIVNPGFTKRIVGRAAIVAVNFSKERFVKKDWVNETSQKWKDRKKPDKGSLLLKSGRLKRSIRKISQVGSLVEIGTDVPYAKIHNEGGTISKTVRVRSHTRNRTKNKISAKTGRKLKGRVSTGTITIQAHSRKMNLKIDQRQFLGQSTELNRRLQKTITQEIINEISNL
jgi:phage gpG-like protein